MQRLIELIERSSNRLKTRFSAVWRAIADPPLRPEDYVIFSKGLYFRIPREQVHVVSWARGDSIEYAMTIGEARNLMFHIREAYNANELRKIEIGAATWTIDCSQARLDEGRIVLKFHHKLVSSMEYVRREDLLDALEEVDRHIEEVLNED